MIICPLHHHTNPLRMQSVVDTMAARGAPQLRGFVDPLTGAVLLREGTHRIAAAHQLGLVPKIVSIRWWRTTKSLQAARFAVARRGLWFERVEIEG